MKLESLQDFVEGVAAESMPALEAIRPVFLRGLSIVRSIEFKGILKTVVEDQNILQFQLEHTPKLVFSDCVIINGDELWFVQLFSDKNSRIVITAFDAYTYKHIRTIRVDLQKITRQTYQCRVYKSKSKTLWIVAKSHSNEHYFIELDIKTKAVLMVDNYKGNEYFWNQVEGFTQNVFMHDVNDVEINPEQLNMTKFKQFYYNEIINPEKQTQLINLARQYDTYYLRSMQNKLRSYVLDNDAQFAVVGKIVGIKPQTTLMILSHGSRKLFDLPYAYCTKLKLLRIGDGSLLLCCIGCKVFASFS